MAKKSRDSINEQQMADKIAESANQIWLAGLAAFEKAQKEGGKIFDKLVKEGEKVENRTRQVTGDSLEEIKSKATGTWDKLEQVFEDRVEKALGSLGVPTSQQLDQLSARVDELTAAVERASARKGAGASKKTTAKTATRVTPDNETTADREPDDLKIIAGVGPVLERKLNEIGVVSYRQIAAWKAKDINEVEAAIVRISGRITRDNWVAQAKAAQKQKYGR
jgi:poly(hydroxyalkanoate) granule-associated protein